MTTHQHDNAPRGWIGVDFDGTLANYGTWVSPTHCGQPIAPMVERVKRWLAEGREVRIFTARCFPITTPMRPADRISLEDAGAGRLLEAAAAIEAIRAWCREHLGQVLTVTCVKDYAMVELYDDRCVQVRPNTGEIVGNSTRGLA